MVYGDLIYTVTGLIFGIFSFWFAGFASKNLNTKFKLVYAVPVVLSGVFIVYNGFEKTLMGAYIISVVVLLGFFSEKRIIRQIVSALLAITMICEIVFCNYSSMYRTPDYRQAFEDGFYAMKNHYCLTNQKGVDFDELYEKYEPLFTEAGRNNDKVENIILWLQFCHEFRDGHVGYGEEMTGDEEKECYKRLYGNDYGLSLLRCSDGSIVAVNVGEGSSAWKTGIVNGTEIVSWDGMTVYEMIEKNNVIGIPENMPVKENEEFFKVICSAGQGGEKVIVRFIDENGSEKEGMLTADGLYYERMNETIDILMNGKLETNLTVTQLNNDTAMIRVSEMGYDANSYGSSNYNEMYEQLKENLELQKNEGVTNLIFDLRENSGGDPNFDRTIFRLILPEGEYVIGYNSVWDYDNNEFAKNPETGGYQTGEPIIASGEGFWGDGKIIVLVNAKTVSAGDMFTEVMSRFDNVIIMGITPSNCSCQAINGLDIGNGSLQFSAVPTLNEDGSVYIDCDETGVATLPLDERILIDHAFVNAVFNEGEDYVLDYAVSYIDGN